MALWEVDPVGAQDRVLEVARSLGLNLTVAVAHEITGTDLVTLAKLQLPINIQTLFHALLGATSPIYIRRVDGVFRGLMRSFFSLFVGFTCLHEKLNTVDGVSIDASSSESLKWLFI